MASVDPGDEVRELHRLAMRDLALGFRRAPGFRAWLEPDAAFLTTGEPVIDLNMLLIGASPRATVFLETSTATAKAQRLPFVAFLTPHVADEFAAAAGPLGLADMGKTPMMVYRADGPITPGKPCEIRLAGGAASASVAGDLVSAAFDLDRGATARAFESAVHPTSSFEVYIASMDGTPVSSVAVTRAGDTAGVWCMATAPARQGQGAGRALLTRVMETQRQDGVARFYLFATTAGQPLYESLGYRTLAECPTWAFAPEGMAAR